MVETILVTGATGTLGSEVVNQLLAAEQKVRAAELKVVPTLLCMNFSGIV